MADAPDLVTLGGIRSRLQSLINRKDLTAPLADQFINQAQSNLERVLRIGSMERVLQASMDGKSNSLPIPSTYLELINMFTDKGEMIQVDMGEWLTMDDTPGWPRAFVKVADRWMFRPTPTEGVTVYVHHYSQSLPLQVATDRNTWTQAATSCLLYTAAELAADHFQDDNRAARFQAKASQYRDELTSQDLDEKFAGPLRVRVNAIDF